MAAPVIGTRPRYAPRPGATVDRSHPLAQGLEFCWVPSVSTNDIANGYAATVNGTPTLTTTPYGAARNFSTTSDGYRFLGTPDAKYTGAMSLLVVGSVANLTGAKTLVEKGPSAFIFYYDTFALTFLRSSDGGSTFRAWQINGPTANVPFMLGVSVADATVTTTPKLYWNGAETAWSTPQGTGTGTVSGTSDPISVGYRPGSTTRTLNGKLTLAYLWSRAISASEAAQLYADPFCFLKS